MNLINQLLKSKPTVADVLEDFQKKVTQLEEIMNDKNAEAAAWRTKALEEEDFARQRVKGLHDKALVATTVADHARSVMYKIKALLI